MRRALVAVLFLVACKESKSADPAASEKPTPTEQPSKQARPRPSLPESGETEDRGDRPRLPGDREPRDWSDPAVRDEMRAKMEERRKNREAMLDTNKDGVVSPEEHAQRMVPMFKRLDTNNDGKLTPEELSASDARMAFDDPAAVDADHNGDISLAELDTAMGTRRQKMRERWRGRDGTGSAGVAPE